MAADSQSPWEGGDRLHSPPAQSAPAAPARKPIYFVLSLFSERTETGSGGRPRLLQPLPGARGWGWKPSRGAAPPQALGAPDRQQEALLRPRTLSLWAGTKAILPQPQATPRGTPAGATDLPSGLDTPGRDRWASATTTSGVRAPSPPNGTGSSPHPPVRTSGARQRTPSPTPHSSYFSLQTMNLRGNQIQRPWAA